MDRFDVSDELILYVGSAKKPFFVNHRVLRSEIPRIAVMSKAQMEVELDISAMFPVKTATESLDILQDWIDTGNLRKIFQSPLPMYHLAEKLDIGAIMDWMMTEFICSTRDSGSYPPISSTVSSRAQSPLSACPTSSQLSSRCFTLRETFSQPQLRGLFRYTKLTPRFVIRSRVTKYHSRAQSFEYSIVCAYIT